jgi:hypothetical protein
MERPRWGRTWALLLLLLRGGLGEEERAQTTQCPSGFVRSLPRGKCYLTSTERYSFTDCQAQVRPHPSGSDRVTRDAIPPRPRKRSRPGATTQQLVGADLAQWRGDRSMRAPALYSQVCGPRNGTLAVAEDWAEALALQALLQRRGLRNAWAGIYRNTTAPADVQVPPGPLHCYLGIESVGAWGRNLVHVG